MAYYLVPDPDLDIAHYFIAEPDLDNAHDSSQSLALIGALLLCGDWHWWHPLWCACLVLSGWSCSLAACVMFSREAKTKTRWNSVEFGGARWAACVVNLVLRPSCLAPKTQFPHHHILRATIFWICFCVLGSHLLQSCFADIFVWMWFCFLFGLGFQVFI